MRKIIIIFCICLAVNIVCAQNSPSKQSNSTGTIFIKAGKLFDSKNGVFIRDQIIVVRGRRIVELGGKITIPQGARIYDFSDKTVLPGLIESHTHMFYKESMADDLTVGGLKSLAIEGDALRVLRGAARAKTYLNAGYTTVWDVGNSGQFLDRALQIATQQGTIEGPRMVVSGPILCSEGGQMKGLHPAFKEIVNKEYRIINGREDAIAAVRENRNRDVDVIKICVNNSPNNTSLTIDEMKAIVETAHKYNLKVIAHATNDNAVLDAIKAGVDRIEHGRGVSDKTFKLMAQKNIPLVPTFASEALYALFLRGIGIGSERQASRIERLTQSQTRLLTSAINAGVKIISGSDNYKDCNMPQGRAAKHTLVGLYEAGMTPVDILKSSTYNASEFRNSLRWVGEIQKGTLADIIAIEGDLEKNFSEAIFNVIFVMKDGKIYKE